MSDAPKPWEINRPNKITVEEPAQQVAIQPQVIESFGGIIEQPLESLIGKEITINPDVPPTLGEVLEMVAEQDLYEGHQKSILAKISQWVEIKAKMAQLKIEEGILRKLFLDTYFTTAKPEGTTRQDLPDGYKLKGEFSLDRKVDETALPAVLERLQEASKVDLIRYKPELNLAVYRKLPDAEKKIVDECLIIKPSSTQLSLEQPKVSK